MRGLSLLDLYCGAGGAAVGYHRAGFARIVGVDIAPMPRYPFEFVQGDALEYLAAHGHEFDAIHASPPCQKYSVMRHIPWLHLQDTEPLVAETRAALIASGKPWVMENVMGAKLPAGWLCGLMFGLPFYRHRAFETSLFWMQPGHPRHRGKPSWNRRKQIWRLAEGEINSTLIPGHPSRAQVEWVAKAMGIDWMDRNELSQAIPPAYTEFIGRHLMRAATATAGW